jgi:hypothetical protein
MSEANSQPTAQPEGTPTPTAPAVETPHVDAFGETVGGEPAQAPEEAPAPDKADLTPTQQIAELSKTVGELSSKLESSTDLHTKKDADIRAMAEKIKRSEGASGGAPEGGEAQEGDDNLPFKEIKSSKDLTEDEKDEMTDGEIKTMDEMAALKKTINDMHTANSTSKAGDQDGVVDVQKTVQETAMALTNQDATKANQIIEAFKQNKFNVAEMSGDELKSAVAMVANTVTGYKKPTENSFGAGNGQPAGAGAGNDPHGVDSIVEQAGKAQTGESYSL